MAPKPIAYVEYEGGNYVKWEGHGRRPERLHAIFFDNGDVFDTQNGWRVPDFEHVEHIRQVAA